MIIDYKVDGQILRRTGRNLIVADSIKYLAVRFNFSDEWKRTKKTVIFTYNENSYNVLLDDDNIVVVPYEVIHHPGFTLSVYGTNNGMRITSSTCRVPVIKSGYAEGETPPEPTQTVYEQILDKLDSGGGGGTGKNGKSAYELAVENGFSGTVDEWLESLKGQPGKDGINGKDGANGKDGINGIDGKDGADGKDITSIDDSAVETNTTWSSTKISVADENLQVQINETYKHHLNDSGNIGNEVYDGAVLTIVDDDGAIDFYNNFVPIYRDKGVRCSFAVIACRAETPTGTTTSGDPYTAMDWTQIKELVHEGFDMQSHTYSHDVKVFRTGENLNEEQLEHQFGDADKLFRQNGLDYNCMVYPWGTAQAIKKRVAKRYAKYGMTLISGDTGLNDEISEPMAISRFTLQSGSTSLTSAKSQIDTAIANKQWLILCTHANANQPSADTLGDIIDYAISKKMRIETFSKAARLKAPVYYTGEGENMFRVMPNGDTKCKLDDDTIRYIVQRATALGLFEDTEASISASYGKTQNIAGDTLDKSFITVILTMTSGKESPVTDYTIEETNLTLAEGENTYHIKYKGLNCTLTVTAIAAAEAAEITQQPQDVTAAVGETANMSIIAKGTDLTYKWQWLDVRGDNPVGTWTNCADGTSSTLQFTVEPYHNLRKYRCIVTSSMGEILTSEVVTLHIGSNYSTLIEHTSESEAIERTWYSIPLSAGAYHFRATVEKAEYACTFQLKTATNNIDDKNGTVMFIAPTGTFNASSAIYTFEGDFTLSSSTEYLFLYTKGITAGKTITIEYYKTN